MSPAAENTAAVATRPLLVGTAVVVEGDAPLLRPEPLKSLRIGLRVNPSQKLIENVNQIAIRLGK